MKNTTDNIKEVNNIINRIIKNNKLKDDYYWSIKYNIYKEFELGSHVWYINNDIPEPADIVHILYDIDYNKYKDHYEIIVKYHNIWIECDKFCKSVTDLQLFSTEQSAKDWNNIFDFTK